MTSTKVEILVATLFIVTSHVLGNIRKKVPSKNVLIFQRFLIPKLVNLPQDWGGTLKESCMTPNMASKWASLMGDAMTAKPSWKLTGMAALWITLALIRQSQSFRTKIFLRSCTVIMYRMTILPVSCCHNNYRLLIIHYFGLDFIRTPLYAWKDILQRAPSHFWRPSSTLAEIRRIQVGSILTAFFLF